MRAHLRCKWMCRVNDMSDLFACDIVHQTGNAPKPALPQGQRLQGRAFGAACIGKHRPPPGFGQASRHLRRFCCASKQEDVLHV